MSTCSALVRVVFKKSFAGLACSPQTDDVAGMTDLLVSATLSSSDPESLISPFSSTVSRSFGISGFWIVSPFLVSVAVFCAVGSSAANLTDFVVSSSLSGFVGTQKQQIGESEQPWYFTWKWVLWAIRNSQRAFQKRLPIPDSTHSFFGVRMRFGFGACTKIVQPWNLWAPIDGDAWIVTVFAPCHAT